MVYFPVNPPLFFEFIVTITRLSKGFFDVMQKYSGCASDYYLHSNGKRYLLLIGICQDLKALMMNGGMSTVCTDCITILLGFCCFLFTFSRLIRHSLLLVFVACLHVLLGRGGSTFFKRHPCMYCAAQNGQLSTEAPDRCNDCCEFDLKLLDLESGKIVKEACIPDQENFKDSQLHQFADLKSSKCHHHEFLDSTKFKEYEEIADNPAFAHLVGVVFPRTNNASNLSLAGWQKLGSQLEIAEGNKKKHTKETWCNKIKDWKLDYEVNFVNLREVADSKITKVCKFFLLHT